MEKNPKIKADAPLAENELRYTKMPQTRYAQTVGIYSPACLFLLLVLMRAAPF